MRQLIVTIEEGLGPERLAKLKRDSDAFQQFWLGVLEAVSRIDPDKDMVAYLISSGYGAVRNMRRSDRTWSSMKTCPECGRVFGYRRKACPECGVELRVEARHSEYQDWHQAPLGSDADLLMEVEMFVETLSGLDAYVARRWMVERADLLFKNHLTQIASELGVSSPRVAFIKKRIKQKFLEWHYGVSGGGRQGHHNVNESR